MNNYTEILARIAEKYRRNAVSAAEAGMIPYKSENGAWVGSPGDGNSWWTGGFWPGLMWQLWRVTGDDVLQAEALRVQDLLTAEFRTFTRLNHDVGFMYLLSCGADYKLRGTEQAKVDTLHAASLLMGRFNPVGYIRAWNEQDRMGYAIIDCMMNVPLLHWATRQTGDPRFAKVAEIHSQMAVKEFVRADGSVCHIIEFDPATGERVAEHGGQGCYPGSQWTRGQAWGLYGFTLAALNTEKPEYLAAAEKIAENFIAHSREDGLIDCDFCQPKDVFLLDNIAGAIAACGLLELEKLTGKEAYRAAAIRMVDAMLDKCVDWGNDTLGLLTHCTAAYHDEGAGRHTNIVYGDYFLVEALCKLAGTDPMLWR